MSPRSMEVWLCAASCNVELGPLYVSGCACLYLTLSLLLGLISWLIVVTVPQLIAFRPLYHDRRTLLLHPATPISGFLSVVHFCHCMRTGRCTKAKPEEDATPVTASVLTLVSSAFGIHRAMIGANAFWRRRVDSVGCSVTTNDCSTMGKWTEMLQPLMIRQRWIFTTPRSR